MNSANNEKDMFDKVTDVLAIIVLIAFVGLLIWAFYAGNSDSDYGFSHLYKSSYSSGSSYSSRPAWVGLCGRSASALVGCAVRPFLLRSYHIIVAFTYQEFFAKLFQDFL